MHQTNVRHWHLCNKRVLDFCKAIIDSVEQFKTYELMYKIFVIYEKVQIRGIKHVQILDFF